MAKEPLAYAIRNNFIFEIITLTKVDHVYYYGKCSSGHRTHGKTCDLFAHYPTMAAALDAKDHIREVVNSVAPDFAEVERLRQQAWNRREELIQQAVNNSGGSLDFLNL